MEDTYGLLVEGRIHIDHLQTLDLEERLIAQRLDTEQQVIL